MKCNECEYYECCLRSPLGGCDRDKPQTIVLNNPGTIKYHEPFDWDRFRAETARDVLAGMMAHPRVCYNKEIHECQIETSIEYADELIKQLKEK